MTTQYHFAAKLYRQDWPEIASQSIDLKIPQRRAWVLAFGQHIVGPLNKFLDPCLEVDPSLQKIQDPPLLKSSRKFYVAKICSYWVRNFVGCVILKLSRHLIGQTVIK
jgi:hypothetical protein